MKKMKVAFATLGAALLLSSCSMTMPNMITQNPIGTKVGRAKGTCFLQILCFGADWSLMSAAKNGGINRVATVDLKASNILGIVQTYETIVTGE